MRPRARAATAAAVGAAMLGASALTDALAARAGGDPATDVIQQKLVLAYPVPDLGNRFLVCDNTPGCAPMFSVNAAGAQSYGEPVCVIKAARDASGKVALVPVICVGGPERIRTSGATVPGAITVYDGRGGSPVTITQHQLRWFEGWLLRHGVR